MLKKISFGLSSFVVVLIMLLATLPVSANDPDAQIYFQTPTAGLDGRIIYVVKAGDTCLKVFLLTNVSIDTLRSLNNLDEQCTLAEGQKLLLGTYAPPTFTPGPSPTPTIALPTPTPFNGNGQICVKLYNDVNGNARTEANEGVIAGGAILITDQKTGNSMNANTTADVDQKCFENLPEGDYTISVAPPQGYNATTTTNYAIKLMAGDISYVNFGAQLSASAVTPEAPQTSGQETDTGGDNSLLLGILGGVLVLAGIGLGVYFKLLSR